MGKYKGKEEKVKIYSVSLHESVVGEVKNRLKSFGGKLSPLIENLLIGWAGSFYTDEEFKKIQQPAYEEYLKRIKEIEEEIKCSKCGK